VYQKLTSLAQWFLVHLPGWLLAGYVASLVFIFIYSFSQAHLIVHYVRSRRHIRPVPKARLTDALPFVTVQLPVYNEKYVVARLLEAVARLRYPAHRLEIQVLDDSTDETTEIIAQKVEELSCLSIRHLRRADRRGYKAGALGEGLRTARGALIAIFDADFIPDPDFLLATVAQFSNPKVGMVQTRWGHVNEAENLLTRLQAFGLDTHFTVEQTGRFAGGFFLNFNGTAGVWRKAASRRPGAGRPTR
jgi:cellulose synthase/poly-beta-1,6-N-acetylglucosamine synthase-like glycosyltransferase